MSLITLWQKPIEEYVLPDVSFVCITYYNGLREGKAVDRFHARYREIKQYFGDELIDIIVEKNPYYDPKYFDSLQQHIEGGFDL